MPVVSTRIAKAGSAQRWRGGVLSAARSCIERPQGTRLAGRVSSSGCGLGCSNGGEFKREARERARGTCRARDDSDHTVASPPCD